jgi:hypothetical protein
MRWNGETDIRTLKGTLSLDQVRCQTPDNVEREVWGTLLGYNLVRRLAATAAYVVKKLLDRTGTPRAGASHWKNWVILQSQKMVNSSFFNPKEW